MSDVEEQRFAGGPKDEDDEATFYEEEVLDDDDASDTESDFKPLLNPILCPEDASTGSKDSLREVQQAWLQYSSVINQSRIHAIATKYSIPTKHLFVPQTEAKYNNVFVNEKSSGVGHDDNDDNDHYDTDDDEEERTNPTNGTPLRAPAPISSTNSKIVVNRQKILDPSKRINASFIARERDSSEKRSSVSTVATPPEYQRMEKSECSRRTLMGAMLAALCFFTTINMVAMYLLLEYYFHDQIPEQDSNGKWQATEPRQDTAAPTPFLMPGSMTSPPTLLLADPIQPRSHCFQNRDELLLAIQGYLQAEATPGQPNFVREARGKMSDWCVGQVTNFTSLFAFQESFNEPLDLWDVSNAVTTREMFIGCSKFNQDLSSWNVSRVTNMNAMFRGCILLNQKFDSWQVSSVTDMGWMFASCSSFQGLGLSNWDVRAVKNLKGTFAFNSKFNANLSTWDVSSVTNMAQTFRSAPLFKSDLSQWDTSSVTDMSYMLAGAQSFQSSLSDWQVSRVRDMTGMFQNARIFNRPLASWDVSRVVYMKHMFQSAVLFNSELQSWNTSSVIDMTGMFQEAIAFNQALSPWNVKKVLDMTDCFAKAVRFNGDLSEWNVQSVVSMSGMFRDSWAFNNDVSNWMVDNVILMDEMFRGAIAFNVDISRWNVVSLFNIRGMFQDASAFSQNLCAWGVVIPPYPLNRNRTTNAFEGSRCPISVDPYLTGEGNPPGPMCFECL